MTDPIPPTVDPRDLATQLTRIIRPNRASGYAITEAGRIEVYGPGETGVTQHLGYVDLGAPGMPFVADPPPEPEGGQ